MESMLSKRGGPAPLTWSMPLPRPHTGPVLANGVQGLLVWGDAQRLIIGIGRAGFWDHRWGNDFIAGLDYARLRELLQAGDHTALRQAFTPAGGSGEDWQHPQAMPAGRLQVNAPPGLRLQQAILDLADGSIRIDSQQGPLWHLVQDPDAECAWLQPLAGQTEPPSFEVLPAWQQPRTRAAMQRRGVAAPQQWRDEAGSGFLQSLPEDAALACQARGDGGGLILTTAVGDQARQEAAARSRPLSAADEDRRRAWWTNYWAAVPRCRLPDPRLQEQLDYGLYKQACCTPPQGLACTLQGPLTEDTQLPPWSNDYHFNINLQMIYTPALASGRSQHLQPVWNLLRSWWPRLQAGGAAFFGDPAAMMLPHAVDDRCQAVGMFWTGCIDHGCTAWMAYLAWKYYLYSGDRNHAREVAWPLLRGAFAGYWAMCEEVEEAGGRRLSLPVSVSPEFKGCATDAWGRDASFQLAAAHAVVGCLQEAAAELGEAVDPRWQRLSEELPRYTLGQHPRTREYPEPSQPRIELWRGMDLIESHRHHSHLAGLFPFDVLDPQAPDDRQAITASIFHWVRSGPGAWSGWSVPWAASLQARLGNGDAAVAWLHWFDRVFTNEGRGTLHDAHFAGLSSLSDAGAAAKNRHGAEVMQLDGGFGLISAILELLVQCHAGEVQILPALPETWQDLDVQGVHAEGGFVIDLSRCRGLTRYLQVRSQRGGRLRLRHGLGLPLRVRIGERDFEHQADVLEIDTRAGEMVHLQPLVAES